GHYVMLRRSMDVSKWCAGCSVAARMSRGRVGGYVPLYWAVYSGELEICRMLLEHNADVNARNELARFHFTRQRVLVFTVISSRSCNCCWTMVRM
ncbi:hypothetical protein BC826DRAFT_991805, partial [Russula brevipes]